MHNILVVEDSESMRALIVAALDGVPDCDVVEADNGLEALRLLPQQLFALVVTDINMPNINGLELLSFIRRSPQLQEIKVLIVSTEASAADRDRGMALGADAYVTKPFHPDELRGAVQRILHGPR